MNTQQIEAFMLDYSGFIFVAGLCFLIGALMASAIKKVRRQPECPTPAEAVRRELAKAIAKTLDTAISKDQFLEEAGRLWDAREILAKNKNVNRWRRTFYSNLKKLG